ncbi:hypothetical protein HZB90_02765 [archaeon]|nr:hypothetical protein [archaeon]
MLNMGQDYQKRLQEFLYEVFLGTETRTSEGIRKIKGFNDQDLSDLASRVLKAEVIDGEHPCSQASLSAKREMLRWFAGQASIRDARLLPDVEVVRGQGENFELSSKGIYHYSAQARCHDSNQDALVSILSAAGESLPYQFHGAFDGVSGCTDGKWAPQNIDIVLDGINFDLFRRGVHTTAIIAYFSPLMMMTANVGDSPGAILNPITGKGRAISKKDVFLGTHARLGEYHLSKYDGLRESGVLLLATDGFLSLDCGENVDITARVIGQYMQTHPDFTGLGPGVKPPTPTKILPGGYVGPGDDASVLLASIPGNSGYLRQRSLDSTQKGT